MFECLIIIIFTVTLSSFFIVCSKKNKGKQATTPTENEKIQEQKRKETAAAPAAPTAPAASGTAEVDKKKTPKPNEPNMAARDANDNETINDAKSDWGELPA